MHKNKAKPISHHNPTPTKTSEIQTVNEKNHRSCIVLRKTKEKYMQRKKEQVRVYCFFFYPVRFLPARENASMRVSVAKKTVVNVFETQEEKKHKHKRRKKEEKGRRAKRRKLHTSDTGLP